MIYAYGAKNYFSFKDGFDISFRLNSKVPNSVSRGKKFTPVLGIKGSNASGKTALLKCLEFLSLFTTRSFKNDEGSGIWVQPFFSSKEPIEFYIDFEAQGVRYIYELICTDERVISEKIFKKVVRKTLLLERNENTISHRIAELAMLDMIVLKSCSSIIDTVRKYKLETRNLDLDNIHDFLSRSSGNVSALSVLHDKEVFKYETRNDFYQKLPEAFKFAKELITKCDLGISDMKLSESTDSDGKLVYHPFFFHSTGGGEGKWLSFYSQSDGTRALYLRLATYWRILSDGGIMVMDEFDTNLHPDILPLIVNLFLDDDTNTGGAQFIFTSHNLEIIDHLGKYRTVLVGKNDGESFAYRLDEIPGDVVRNDRQISALYREGKLGGVPRL